MRMFTSARFLYSSEVINPNRFSMGMTAAIMTSMALIAGLTQGGDAKVGIISGLLIIAIADNISDSFSIHMYCESEGASEASVRVSTFGNFAVRFVLVLTFALIVLLLPSNAALVVSSLWGLGLLGALSYRISLQRRTNPVRDTVAHLLVASLVIICSKVLGNIIVHLAAR